VIFSDVDVLFTGDMTEVYNEDMDSYEWAGVAAEKNDDNMIMHKYYPENKHKYMYWDGFMIMNLKLMRDIGWVKKCNDNIEKYKDRLQMCDLEILNLTAEKIKKLPFRYVCLQSIYENDDISNATEFEWLSRIYSKDYLEKEKESVKIIHYAGKVGKIGKPWLRFNPPHNYNRYLKTLPLHLKRQNLKMAIWENLITMMVYILKRIFKK
jgi:lipopolysaccharide biosynthesis glycosyltransferase